ncbi:MAG TPA: GH116 family glycosyl-hydrolase [Armatimonadota bacterium]|nr:GH116 family glycosyl-hydrolase [Armatimonadota bacterium]
MGLSRFAEIVKRGRSFTGRSLQEIAFPLGGIGTGTVSLGGRGQLRDWEIFNRPGKGRDLPYSFFALWTQAEGQAPVSRVLERRLQPPYTGGFGLPTGRVSGLPRLAEAHFCGCYPGALIEFVDAALPVEISLEAFNPMIPLDDEASGVPAALFRWRLRNRTDTPLKATIAMSLLNAVGYGGADDAGSQFQTGNRHAACFGRNLNTFAEAGESRGFRMTSSKYDGADPRAGSMALMTPWSEVTYLTHWERAGWWDDLQNFWDDFSSDGRLPDDPDSSPSPDGQTDVGSLGLRVNLAAGESAALPFALAWNFPNLANYWNQEAAVHGRRLGNYYSRRFEDAWDAGAYLLENLDRLESDTLAYLDTLSRSSLPGYVLDAVSSQSSIIRTTTCLRTEGGRFHAFEGCGDQGGCCPLNCTHVWNYEQAVAHLFPALERTMRDTDYGFNTERSGRMGFRTLVPLAEGQIWAFAPAADGQMGTICKLYREWKTSGDTDWLRSLWPAAKRSLEFAWSTENAHAWDANRDGVMEGIQHNTYDIEFCGPNTMMGSWYLAALRAAAEMAIALDEPDTAANYLELSERGAAGHDSLFNGEYYEQRVEFDAAAQTGRLTALAGGIPADGDTPRYQYGAGCLSDQLLGQWFAHCVGLGYVLPEERVKAAVGAIHRYNFKHNLNDHPNCQRIYALNDEAGALLCSWPRGGRPRYPFPYADEVWTGIEYQVAAHLIFEGLIEEGLEIVRAVRDRYDGEKRNPWNEVECGHHYARAMSSWSLLLALSGCRWDATTGSLGFAPRINVHDFRCFFCAGTGWGMFEQSGSGNGYRAAIELQYGELTLRSLRLPVGAGWRAIIRSGSLSQSTTAAPGGVIGFSTPITLRSGDQLKVAGPAPTHVE